MCEPASIALAGIALTAATTVVGAYSAYQQQKSSNRAAEFNASMMRRNAKVAELQAQNAEQQGAVDEKKHRLEVSQLIGSQRAGVSANGLLVDSGTPLDLTSDSEGFGELDALTIRNNAARRAWALRNESADYTAQGELSLMKRTSPVLAAGGSLLSGGSNLATQVASYSKTFR